MILSYPHLLLSWPTSLISIIFLVVPPPIPECYETGKRERHLCGAREEERGTGQENKERERKKRRKGEKEKKKKGKNKGRKKIQAIH